jgi:DNA-nicking Smr family endonuclease
MAKKKHTEPAPKPAQFRATPFSALKGVVAAEPRPAAEPVKAAPPAPLPEDDGAELFLQAMGGVKKLKNAPTAGTKGAATQPSRSQQKQPPAPSPVDKASAELFLEEIGRLKMEVKFTEALPDEDELTPLSGNRLRQVKRGIISVDRQLDLHGLNRDEALAELPRFLRNARIKGCAAVLVITGKGLNSPGEPVLQQVVAGWLRDAGRELVVEYSPAPREMGGNGAFVVFLRPLPKPAGKPA